MINPDEFQSLERPPQSLTNFLSICTVFRSKKNPDLFSGTIEFDGFSGRPETRGEVLLIEAINQFSVKAARAVVCDQKKIVVPAQLRDVSIAMPVMESEFFIAGELRKFGAGFRIGITAKTRGGAVAADGEVVVSIITI